MTEVRLIYADAQKAKIAVDALSGHKKICVCGLIDDATTIPDIDRAAIMRLCNEIEEIVTAIANWSAEHNRQKEAYRAFIQSDMAATSYANQTHARLKKARKSKHD